MYSASSIASIPGVAPVVASPTSAIGVAAPAGKRLSKKDASAAAEYVCPRNAVTAWRFAGAAPPSASSTA